MKRIKNLEAYGVASSNSELSKLKTKLLILNYLLAGNESVYSQFPVPNSRFPIPVPRFPFPDSRSPIPVPRFPFPDSRSPIPFPRFPFPDSLSPIPFPRFPFPNSRWPDSSYTNSIYPERRRFSPAKWEKFIFNGKSIGCTQHITIH